MKVILLEKVKTLGGIGEILNVAEGYARNFLFPRKLAVAADEKNKNVLQDKQKRLAKKIASEKDAATAIKKKLDGLTLELIKKVGQNGKLFGAVTSSEISKELESRNIIVEKRLISMDSIKSLGTFEAKAKLFGNEVVANFKVKVMIDPVQAEELKRQQEEAAKRNAEKKKAKAEAEAKAKAEAEAAAAGQTEA
jgi:large subunit ribosomal protein L9